MLLLLYGMRCGEVPGLRWCDVDEDGELRVRQQIQCVHGELRVGPVKTAAGPRDLSLLAPTAEVLEMRRAVQATDRLEVGDSRQDTCLIFSTKAGRSIEPRDLARSSRQIIVPTSGADHCRSSRAGQSPGTPHVRVGVPPGPFPLVA